MLDLTAAHTALRARLVATSVCTTGSTALSATSTGYARTAGSFVTDGFVVGMEVSPSGFSVQGNNAFGIVTAVTATTLQIHGGRTAEAEAGSRTIAVGIPLVRSWESAKFTPDATRPFIDEELVPAGSEMISGPAEGGTIEEIGLYILNWRGLPIADNAAIRKGTDAIKARFAPHTKLAVGADTLRVRGDIGPWASEIEPDDRGWMVSVVTIPWLAYTNNTIAP